MTYSAVYCALISKRLKNPITKDDCYVEQHHIIPKSEGGKDEPDNLVNLTAREHYIAHLLLAKIYKDYKMFAAVRFMRMKSGKSSGRDFKFNSRLYERMKVAYNKTRKGRQAPNKGKPMSEEQKRKISLVKKSMPLWNRGIRMSDSQKKQISKTMSLYFWWNNGEVTVRAKECPEGFVKGRLNNTGKHWFNNGITETYSFECPEGFVKGRLSWKH